MLAAVPFTPDDFNAAVKAVAGEAANQPPEGQAAVASTILNRAMKTGAPIRDIASDTAQYNAIDQKAVPGSPTYSAIAPNIAAVFTKGPTTDATHYLNPELQAKLGRKQPDWAQGDGTRIGDHVFYNRSDLIGSPTPSADELEKHFASHPVDAKALPNLPGYVSDPNNVPGNGPWSSGAVQVGGPTADDLEKHFGSSKLPANATPQQNAAQADANQVESAVSALGARMGMGSPRFGGNPDAPDMMTPFMHGLSQGFSDEAKGKLFGGITGAKNVVLNALGQPIPYGMSDADAAMTGAARRNLAAISSAHPIASMAAETAGAVLPWVAGGEALGAGKAVAEAPTALGRVAQLGGRIISGGAKGSALGAVGGGITGFGNAEGDAGQRASGAEQGALTGAELGGVIGAGAPVVAPVVGKVASALGGEIRAGAGAAAQGTRNALGNLRGNPTEITAAEHFAANSPTAQKLQGAFSPPDVAESAVPTPAETRAAQSRVTQMMGAKGMHTDDLRAIPEDIPHTTAEAIGSQTVNHLASLARRSGTTPDAAGTQIAERTRNFGASILDDFGKATGIHPEEAAGNIEALTTRLKGEADPMFAAVRSHPGPVWSPDLAKIAERPVVAKAIDAAARDMLNGGKDPLAVGFKLDPDTGAYTLDSSSLAKTVENQPTAEAWENVRQRLGDQVDRNPLTGRIVPDSQSRGNYNINVAKRDLTTILAGDKNGKGALIPGYRNALDTSGEQQGLQSAFDRGQTSLLTDKTSARDFAKAFSSLSPADQKAWTAGAANKLYDASQTSRGLTPSVVKSPAFQDKIRTMMGDQADEFLDRLSQRIRLHATGQRIMPGAGSQTQPLLQAGAETGQTVDALGNAIKDVLHAKASPGTFIAKQMLGASLGDRAANVAETPGYRNAYGRLLLQHPRATADELRAAGREAVRMLPRNHLPVAGVSAYVGGQQQPAPQ